MVTAIEIAALKWVGVSVPVKGPEDSTRIVKQVAAHTTLPFLLQFDRYDRPPMGEIPHITFRCPKDDLPRLLDFLNISLGLKVPLDEAYDWDELPGVVANAYIGSQVALEFMRYAGTGRDPFQIADFLHFLLDGLGFDQRAEAALYRIMAARLENAPQIYISSVKPPKPASW